MLRIGIIGLPCVVMGLAFLYAIQGAYHSHRPTRPLFLYPLICSFVLTSGFMIWGYHAICTSRSSTAAIGFLFLPFESIVVAAAGVVVSWSVLYVAHFVIQRIRGIALGLNPSTPTKTLRQLAEDQDDLVRTYAKPRLRSREHGGKSQQE